MEELSLTQRLRNKLNELDAIHREKCAAVTALDDVIRRETGNITELPLKQAQIEHMIQDLKREHDSLQNLINLEESKLALFQKKGTLKNAQPP